MEHIDPAIEKELYGRVTSAISLASEYDHVEVVKLLLNDPRVDPSTDDNAAIRFASNYGRVEVVKLLVNDPRVDQSGVNLYHSAICRRGWKR